MNLRQPDRWAAAEPAEASGRQDAASGQSAAPLPVTAARGWASVFILMLMMMVAHIDRNIIGMLSEHIKADLEIDDVQLSLLQGLAFAVMYVIAIIPIGWLADRMSRRKLLFIGIAFWSASTVACGLARSFVQLFAARLALGLGEATFYPCAYSLVPDFFARHRLTLAYGVLGIGSTLATGLVFAASGYLMVWAQDVSHHLHMADWQFVYVLVALPGFLVAPLAFLIPERRGASTASQAQAADGGYVRYLYRNIGYLLPLCIAMGCHSAVGYTIMWTPAFFGRTMNLPIEQIGLIMGLITSIPTVIGFLAMGWIVDGLFARGVKNAHFVFMLFNTSVLGIAGAAAYGLGGDLTTVLVLICISNVMLPCAGPAMAHMQITTPPQYRGRTVAFYTMIVNISGMIGGPSGAAMFSEYLYGGPSHIGLGIATVYALGSGLGVACLLFAYPRAAKALAHAMDTTEEEAR